MKIYGNPKSDGFGLYCTLIGAVFALGAMGMTELSGFVLPAGLLVLAGLVAAMTVSLKRWDVMSEAPAPAGNNTGVPVRMPNFPMAAQTDAKPADAKASWAANGLNDSMLPQQVEQPKPSVETNALPV